MGLSPDLATALAALCRSRVILVASDFDGVLAPFVRDPMDARALDGTVDDLAALAGLPDTHAAVVSGRDLEVLTALTGLAPDSPVTRLASHGAQSSRSAGDDRLTAEQQELLDTLTTDLRDLLAGHPGARLELKPKATVLHTRGEDPSRAAAAVAAALEVAARHTGVKVLQGKDVVEMAVVSADKGTALMALRDEVGADAVAYFGDDVTDEHAFEVMGGSDVSVKVGPGQTAARCRIDSPEDAAEALHMILELRRGA
jgi:trehalose 6-phosphate phosphatase